MKKIVILGSTAPEIVKLLAARQARDPMEFELLGFLDDDPARHGMSLVGHKVLGSCALLRGELRNAWVVNNVARTTAVRRQVWQRLESLGARFYTALHPSVDTAHCKIGEGSIMQENVVLGAGAEVGRQCLFSFGAVVAHESVVGDCCFLAPGTILNGRITLKEGVFVGAGAVILPNVVVGEWSVVGAGSLVTGDVPPHCTVFGSPARVIADRSAGRDAQ